jgi:hypothetical protein
MEKRESVTWLVAGKQQIVLHTTARFYDLKQFSMNELTATVSQCNTKNRGRH